MGYEEVGKLLLSRSPLPVIGSRALRWRGILTQASVPLRRYEGRGLGPGFVVPRAEMSPQENGHE